jgi:hypothetical protein
MRARGIRFPWANLVLLLLLVVQLATGLVGLLGTGPPFRWAFWLHAIGAYGIVVLLFAKGTLVLHAIRRRPGLTQARVTLSVLVVLLLVVLVTGLVWITAGTTIYVLGISLINLHAYLALLLFALLAWHVVDRRWIVRVPAARDRAAFLRLAGVVVAGVALWQIERTAQRLTGAPGSRRRFTGSYETGSFTGVFPAVSWFNDDPEPLAASDWRIVVDGRVGRPVELSYDELLERGGATVVATIDCTGGWCSEQEWGRCHPRLVAGRGRRERGCGERRGRVGHRLHAPLLDRRRAPARARDARRRAPAFTRSRLSRTARRSRSARLRLGQVGGADPGARLEPVAPVTAAARVAWTGVCSTPPVMPRA